VYHYIWVNWILVPHDASDMLTEVYTVVIDKKIL